MKIKAIRYSLTLLVLLSLVISACKKDKTENTPQNQVSYYGVSYPMDKAFAIHYSKKAVGHKILLGFLSPGATLHTTGNVMDSVTGMGQALSIYLSSTDSTTVSAADYTYDSSANYYRGTFSIVQLAPAYNFTADTGTLVNAIGGIVFVKKTGTIYNINYNGADKTGKLVSLIFSGEIKDYIK